MSTTKNFVQNNGDIPLMKSMFQTGSGRVVSDINIRDRTWNDGTALMYQSSYGTLACMEFLLANDPPADPNLKDKYGYTALMWAVLDQDTDNGAKVTLLLEYGADPSIKDNDGFTVMEHANSYDQINCIKALESYSSKIPG